jgi:hypothetical protein
VRALPGWQQCGVGNHACQQASRSKVTLTTILVLGVVNALSPVILTPSAVFRALSGANDGVHHDSFLPRPFQFIIYQVLGSFQSKALRMIVDAPWYVPNTVIRRDLQAPTVKEEIRRYSSPQRTPKRPSREPHGEPDNRRLRRHLPNDLPTRFLV